MRYFMENYRKTLIYICVLITANFVLAMVDVLNR